MLIMVYRSIIIITLINMALLCLKPGQTDTQSLTDLQSKNSQ